MVGAEQWRPDLPAGVELPPRVPVTPGPVPPIPLQPPPPPRGAPFAVGTGAARTTPLGLCVLVALGLVALGVAYTKSHREVYPC